MQIKCGIKGVVVSVGSRQLIFLGLNKKTPPQFQKANVRPGGSSGCKSRRASAWLAADRILRHGSELQVSRPDGTSIPLLLLPP